MIKHCFENIITDTIVLFGDLQGGVDQGMPIIVSRVAPDTPADLSNPRLNEGDQVMFINGRDVSQHTHEQVACPMDSIFFCRLAGKYQLLRLCSACSTAACGGFSFDCVLICFDSLCVDGLHLLWLAVYCFKLGSF